MVKKVIVRLLVICGLAAVLSSFGITYSGYVAYQGVNQSVGIAGSRYIYLRPHGENVDWTTSSATFFIYSWEGENTDSAATSATNYLFTTWDDDEDFGSGTGLTLPFPVPKYSNFMFLRGKNGLTLNTMKADRAKALRYTTDDGGYLWNRAQNLTLGTSNLYTFEGENWGTVSASVYSSA